MQVEEIITLLGLSERLFGLSNEEQTALEIIDSFWKQYCQPPSLDQIGAELGGRAKSSVRLIVQRIEKKGYVKIMETKPIPYWVINALSSSSPSAASPLPPLSIPEIKPGGRLLSWFSCGAASAVNSFIALKALPPGCVELVYCNTSAAEHPDNQRFLKDVENWLSTSITILSHPSYTTPYEVWKDRKFIVSPPPVVFAPCTKELKMKLREEYQSPLDIHTFGYTADERERADRFVTNNPEVKTWFPLVELGITKQDCINALKHAGIEIPAMYRLGYRGNNCIGCPKGSLKYWRKIKEDFPDRFEMIARLEKEINARIFSKAWLPDALALPEEDDDEDFECGPFSSCDRGAKRGV